MSDQYIPEHINPYRYAEQGLALSGALMITDMPRLIVNVASQENHQDKVAVDLQFGIDEQGITFIKGHLTTQLTLQCQRCLEPFSYEIMSDFALGIIDTIEQADTLPEHYEPALAQEGMLALRELIEDEIMLNLPIIPRHAPDSCKVQLPQMESGWEQGKEDNPFRVLESLKYKRK